jgi:hypothetical protein
MYSQTLFEVLLVLFMIYLMGAALYVALYV